MSLGGALQIGRSALIANQTAIEVTGNNLANVATKGYHRQEIALAPIADQEIRDGVFVGRGVQVQQVLRQIDEALEGRVRTSVADESASASRQDVLSQIESLQNELSGNDLSTHLGELFNAWSELANNPQDNSVRNVVTQQGATVASFLNNLRSQLGDLRTQVDSDINASVSAANDLLTRIEALNNQIAQQPRGADGAHGLKDQRDGLLAELSQSMDVSTVDLPSGAVDVYVGSLPVILNGRSRGLDVRRQTVNGELQIDVVLKSDGSVLQPRSGRLGALIQARRDDVNHAIDVLDDFTNQLIFQVNRIHSQGQGASGFTSLTGTSKVKDASAALNDPAAGLDFVPNHGSFQIHLTQKSSGQSSASTIAVDLDGINPGSDTSLTSLVAQLNSVANVNASITSDGRLKIATTSNDFEISFSDDSSGVLAALGLNTFFQGSNAADVAVNSILTQDPGKLAAGQGLIDGDNRNALAIAALRDQPLAALHGMSLSQTWDRHIEDYAVRLGQATQQAQANTTVRENLEAQQQSTSGVNSDEEAINLLSFQRAYQGSARFLSVVDQLYQTLLQMV